MGARSKLNFAFVQGALLAAAAIGLSMNSWSAFVGVAGILIAMQMATGGIRPGA